MTRRAATRHDAIGLVLLNFFQCFYREAAIKTVIAWPEAAYADETASLLDVLQKDVTSNHLIEYIHSECPSPLVNDREAFVDSL